MWVVTSSRVWCDVCVMAVLRQARKESFVVCQVFRDVLLLLLLPHALHSRGLPHVEACPGTAGAFCYVD